MALTMLRCFSIATLVAFSLLTIEIDSFNFLLGNAGRVQALSALDKLSLTTLWAGNHSSTSFVTSGSEEDAALLLEQAKALREEALLLQNNLNESRKRKQVREQEKVDRWIEELLIAYRVNEKTEMLKTVDQAVERMQQDRYSPEQIRKIFKRLCQMGPRQSRSSHSPLMALFMESVAKMDEDFYTRQEAREDEVDRDDDDDEFCAKNDTTTPSTKKINFRWNTGRVELALQRQLFAADWNIDLEEQEEDSKNP